MFSFRQRWVKIMTALLLCGSAALLGGAWWLGGTLCAPKPSQGVTKHPDNLPVEDVTFTTPRGNTLHGWVLAPVAPKGVIILQHGVRSSREGMVARARFLHQAGYAVLLYDFQAHGESPGTVITMGHLESQDAQAAVAFVKQRFPGQPVGVIGVSLGGAAAILAQPPLAVQALVLESVYPTIEDAAKDRVEMRFGRWSRALSPLLTAQLPFRLGCSTTDLRPIDHVCQITVPKLFLAGTEDRHTKLAEAEALFARAAEPKTFHPVPGAKHEDLHRYLSADYEKLILDFFQKNLTSTAP